MSINNPLDGKSHEQREAFDIEVSVARPEDERAIWDIQFQSSLTALVKPEIGATEEWVRKGYENYGSDGKLTDAGEQELSAYIQELTENPPKDSESFVARENANIIGFCTVSRMGDRNRLVGIYTLPDEAKGKGVGMKLWLSARKFLDPAKDTIVTLMDYNDVARNFYTKLGFKEEGRRARAENDGVQAGLLDMVLKAEIEK